MMMMMMMMILPGLRANRQSLRRLNRHTDKQLRAAGLLPPPEAAGAGTWDWEEENRMDFTGFHSGFVVI